jgi:outer membrane lipoprotein LolB
MTSFLRGGLALLLMFCGVVGVSGCAPLPPSGAAIAAGQIPAVRLPRAAIQKFSLEGRIVVQQGERQEASNIHWQHGMTTDEILLSTPLGQGLAELQRDAAGARLRLADGRQFAAADWAQLAEQLFGLSLPLSAMPRWLLGEATTASASWLRDAQGRPRQLTVDGWQIHYLAYESEAADALPVWLELRHADIEVRLRVTDWWVNEEVQP